MPKALPVLGSLILALSCTSSKSFLTGKYIEGYEFNSLPNKNLTNGYIYCKKKRSDLVYYLLTIPLPAKEGPVSLHSGEKLVKTNFGTFLEWMGNISPRWNASGNLSYKSEVKMRVEFQEAKLIETPLVLASDSIKAASKRIEEKMEGITEIDDYDFFIVVSTIMAKKMDYFFEKNVGEDINFKINIDSIVTVNPDFSISKDQLTKLQFDDSTYRNVLYKPLKLSVNRSLSGDYNIKLIP